MRAYRASRPPFGLRFFSFVCAPPGRPKARAPWGERRAAPVGGSAPSGRPKARAPWGERRAAPVGGTNTAARAQPVDLQHDVLTKPAAPAWRSAGPFRLLDVEVRPASNEIVVNGTVSRVKPRLMDVLLRLAAAPGEVVPRETLLTEVWPRRMVNDDVLSRVIADLRDALHDDAREARFIETIPKVGYRLIAPMLPVVGATPAPLPASTRAPRRRLWQIAGALAAAIVFTLALVLRPADPPVTDERARLEGQLARAEPFSSDVTLEVGPRFSPDGRFVAFAAGRGARAQIVVREVASAQRRTFGDPADLNLSPVYFPDGKRIAFYRRTPDGVCAIVALDLETLATQPLVDCARQPRVRFDLSPDGKRLVYVATLRADFPAGLVVRDLGSGEDRTLTTPEPEMGDDLLPRFSPDGAQIVFFRGAQSHREIWIVNADDPASARNTQSPRGLAYGAAWLGRQGPLLVAADWFGQRSLNLFDPVTRTAAAVGARGARFPDVDAAGNIVYENAVYASNLYLVDPQAPAVKPRELWPATRYTNQPEYSPDGTRVLFVSNRDGASGIFVATIDGPAAKLPLPDGFIYMRPHWSLDGNSIYAIRASRREDGGRLQQGIRIKVPEGSVEVLAALGDAVFDVREADASGRLIVGEIVGNASRILRTPAAAPGAGERLPLPNVTEYQVAAGRLAYQQPQLPGLTLCDLATLACAPVAVAIDESNQFDWLLTADAIWYGSDGSPPEVVRYDLARRAITWRGSFAPTALGLSLAVRPDGNALLVAREADLAIDLMFAPRSR
jgi:DNA-binding winged helix-turn-helix (wHTH) protein/Tol biopolymer transport system component